MTQTIEQLLQWFAAEMPRLQARVAQTQAAIGRARRLLGEGCEAPPAA